MMGFRELPGLGDFPVAQIGELTPAARINRIEPKKLMPLE
jgi:hypothetical protein